jgi:hypothetical protein
MLRVAEVHLDVGGEREALVVSHLFASGRTSAPCRLPCSKSSFDTSPDCGATRPYGEG